MSYYARLEDDFDQRQQEITCEESRLYINIVFQSRILDNGLRVCKKSVKELCEIYPFLDYDNTTRRIKRLEIGMFSDTDKLPKNLKPMKSPWLKQERHDDEIWLIPLVGVRYKGEAKFEDRKSFRNRPRKDKKSLKNSVKQESISADHNGHKSQFTLEECFKYASSQPGVHNPQALALTIHRTGEADAFIMAALYPPDPEEPTDPFDENRLNGILAYVLEARENGLPIEDYRKFVNEEDWQWVLSRLAEAAKS